MTDYDFIDPDRPARKRGVQRKVEVKQKVEETEKVPVEDDGMESSPSLWERVKSIFR